MSERAQGNGGEQFARLVRVLMAWAREVGLPLVSVPADLVLEQVIETASRAAESLYPVQPRGYEIRLTLAGPGGLAIAADGLARVGQKWEALGGSWGGRFAPAEPTRFLWIG